MSNYEVGSSLQTKIDSKVSTNDEFKKEKVKEKRFDELKIELSREQKADLCEAFNIFDKHGDGIVNLDGLKITLIALGFHVQKNDLRKLIRDVNPNARDDYIPYQDFIKILETKMCEDDEFEDQMKMFHILDVRNNGSIDFRDLKHINNILGLSLNNEELQEMLDIASDGKSERISFSQFSRAICRNNLNNRKIKGRNKI